MTDALAPLPADVGEPLPLVPHPDEPYAPVPQYVPPLERNVVVGPMVVSTCVCPQCGALFALGIPLTDGDTVHTLLAADAQPRCPRCELVPLTVPPDVATVMAHVRWKLDEWHRVKAVGSGEPQAAQRSAGLAASQAFWIHGPALLAALEAVYGNQVLAQTQAIVSGG